MMKILLLALLAQLLIVGNARAGWYRVTNYVGQIGSHSIHLSLQRYEFGPGITVEGSYYYDNRRSPIPLYGRENNDKSISLCEVHTHEEYQKDLVSGFKNGFDVSGCQLRLMLITDGAVGQWSDSKRTYAVSLRRVGSLDNRNVGQLSGTMEVPFWGQTEHHAFVGIYQDSIPQVQIHVISKKTGVVVQTFEPDCDFGYYMTPIYMNIEEFGHGETVVLNCGGPKDVEPKYYSLNEKTGKFRLSR